MSMNNKQINKTMRQAISYAMDYDYVIEELGSGNAYRLISPIPEGILYNSLDMDYPTYNFTHARQLLLDAGIVPAGTDIADDN